MAELGALTQKIGPLPAWGWAAIGGGGLLAVATVRHIRKKSSTSSSSSTAAGTPAAADSSQGSPFSGGGSAGGSSDPGSSSSPGTGQLGGGTITVNPNPDTSTTGGDAGGSPAGGSPAGGSPAPGPLVNTQPRSLAAPDQQAVPVGYVNVGGHNIHNALESLIPTQYFTPSNLDQLATRPQGVDFRLEAPASNPSHYSTIYTNVPAGTATGPIVDAAHKITGERYAALPGGKYQVIS